MKKIASAAVAVALAMGAGSAVAANSLKAGTFGLSVPAAVNTPSNLLTETTPYIITGRYFLNNTLALNAGIGLGMNGGDFKGTDVGLAVGVRKYLSSGDFAPFAGGFLSHSSTMDSTSKATHLMGEFGAEYFLGPQFSVEGSAQIGYSGYEIPDTTFGTGTTIKGNRFGTHQTGIGINFYF